MYDASAFPPKIEYINCPPYSSARSLSPDDVQPINFSSDLRSQDDGTGNGEYHKIHNDETYSYKRDRSTAFSGSAHEENFIEPRNDKLHFNYPDSKHVSKNSPPYLDDESTHNPNLSNFKLDYPHKDFFVSADARSHTTPSQRLYPITHQAPAEFNQAVNYVNKIKSRFSSEPNKYKKFLEILQGYQKGQMTINDAYQELKLLFASEADLLEEFEQFLPGNSEPNAEVNYSLDNNNYFQRKRSFNEDRMHDEKDNTYKKKYCDVSCLHDYTSKHRCADLNNNIQPATNDRFHVQCKSEHVDSYHKENAVYDKLSENFTPDELEFFKECKKAVSDRKTYNKFMNLLYMFSQDLMKIDTLVEKVEPLLSKSPGLFDYFKSLVYKRENFVNQNDETGTVDAYTTNSAPLTHSYRRLSPSKIAGFKCSGRDDLCREVLNDEWVSHPVYVSESGFVSHKKTQYEEELYKCEDERYEFDLNIESNLKSISILEVVMDDIKRVPPEERNLYKLSPNFCGTSKFVFWRTIKKIYGKERGQEMINVILDVPYCAIPIVLKRLIQKNEEWMRAQRKINRVLRRIGNANYYKALDYQGVNFRVADRRAISARNLIAEIENIYREQRESNDESVRNQKYQLKYYFEDPEVFRAIRKLLRKQLSVSINSTGINETQLTKVVDFIEKFIPSFFCLTSYVNKNGRTVQNEGVSDKKYSWSRYPKQPAKSSSYSHKVNISKPNTKAVPSDTGSKFLYSNNIMYVFFRLYRMLYSRLYKMKVLSEEMDKNSHFSGRRSRIAVELGLQKKYCYLSRRNRYDQLLHDIKLLLDNSIYPSEFENRVRNLFGISAYITFTIDKLSQALLKQILIIVNDQKSSALLSQHQFLKLRSNVNINHLSACLLDAESIVQGDVLYATEYHPSQCLMKIRIVSKEDLLEDQKSLKNDKWSSYMEQFIQKDVANENVPGALVPFLKRNIVISYKIGKSVLDGGKFKVYIKSGLEIKICTNTYKMFFVENTEDLFYRRWLHSSNSNVDHQNKANGLPKSSRSNATTADTTKSSSQKKA